MNTFDLGVKAFPLSSGGRLKTLKSVFTLALVSTPGGSWGIKVGAGAWNTLLAPVGSAAGLGSPKLSENTSLGEPFGVKTFEKTFTLAPSSETGCRTPALDLSASLGRGTDVGVGAPGSLVARARRPTSGVTKDPGPESTNGLN